MIEKIYAHSIPGEPPDKWQSLENHLEKVAQIAGNFAQPFDGSIWAQLLGLSHDIGKGSLPWQAYLRHENEIFDDFAKYYIGRVEHSAHGAQGLYENSKESGKLMAYCVGGHHGGLPNWVDFQGSSLKERLKKACQRLRSSQV